jgi:hypothetical protein
MKAATMLCHTLHAFDNLLQAVTGRIRLAHISTQDTRSVQRHCR